MSELLRTMIVEDSEDDAMLLRRELDKAGFRLEFEQVASAKGMREALQNKTWDVIICDYSMPSFKAPEALKILRETGRDIPFIVVSGTIGEETAVEMMKAGANDYVMKGDLTRLGPAIRRELAEAADRGKRRKAEEKLKHERDLLNSLLDNSPDHIYFKDRESRFTRVNTAQAKLLGCSKPADIIGKTDFDFFSEEHAGEAYRDEQRVITTGEPIINKEERETWPDGRVTWVSTTKMPIRDVNGNIIGTFGISRDITEKMRAEEEIRNLAKFPSENPSPVMRADRNGTIIYANAACGTLMKIFNCHVGGKIPQHCKQITDKAFETGDTQYFTMPAGEKIFSFIAVPFVDSDYVNLYGSDITEMKAAEDAMRNSEQLMRGVVDTTPACIFVKDAEGKYLLANKFMADLHETTPEAMIGKTDLDFLGKPLATEEDIKRFRKDDQEVTIGGKSKLIPEEPFTRIDGTIRWFQTIKVPLKLGESQNYMLGIAVDITDRKLAEDALQESQRQLLHAQRMEAIGRLAGGIAHDFRNQLTVVKGYCDLLLPTLEKDNKIRDSIEQIRTAAERAAATTSQLLAFSRKDFLKPAVVNVNALINDMQGPLSHVIGEDVRFDIIVSDESQNIEVDQSALHQAIMNMVINSRDAMPKGGRLVIETQRVEIGTAFVQRHPGATPGTYVLLSIKDTGEGMDAETQSRMFDPFFTTKDVGKGTGLGLSMVYGFVKSGGGFIDVQSKPGEGTTINIYMPWSSKTPQILAKEEGFTPRDVLHGNETVLVVEDEEAVRRLIVDVLRERGYTVLETGNAKEALPLGKHYTEKIDLLITDVVMPGMSGPELAKKLKVSRPKMKTMFISGYSEEAITNQDMIDASRNLLAKPFGPEELAVAVRRFLDKNKIT